MTSVLVADDAPSVRRLIRLTLESTYELIEAGDGQEALRQLHDHHPPIAILDVNMPGLGGLDLCRAIRQDPQLSSTVVIIITANGAPTDRAAASAAGANFFITKPFSPSVMHRLIERVVAEQTVHPQ